MNVGSLELVLLTFNQGRFKGEIADELSELMRQNIIKVIDVLIVAKDQDGDVAVVEAADLDDQDYQAFTALFADLAGYLSEEDADDLLEDMPGGSVAILLLFENTWSIKLTDAVRRAGGELAASRRIPRDVVEKVAAVTS